MLGLNDSVGNWTFDPQEIHDIILGHFNKTYTIELTSCPKAATINPSLLSILPQQDRDSLTKPPLISEIKNAIQSFKPLKAPGPGSDGIHPVFFQKYWIDTGSAVIDSCINAFTTLKIPEDINKTFVTLIPKVKHPQNITQYSPISLCNTIYKTIIKIIVN